ncbi:MAG: TolC family protein [Bacteroidota bacterium]
MMKRLLVALLISTAALAQEQRTLTVDEAVLLGLQNNRPLHIAEAKAAAADAKSGEVNAARLPSVKLQAGYTRLSDVEPFAVKLPSSPTPVVISPTVLDQYTSRVSLQQPLFTGFRLENSAAAADYSAQASHFDVKREMVDVAYNVKAAYWTVYKAMEVKRVVDENVGQIEAHLADVENMMAQGLVTRNEVLKVEVQLSSAQLARIEAANNVKNATMALNNLIGLPLETGIQIASTPGAQGGPTPVPDTLARRALVTRADVRAAELKADAAEATVAAANGGWWPQINLYGNFSYSRPNPRIMPTKDEFKDTWDVGVSLSWDLWNWGSTKHQSDQAEAARAQSRYALEQLKDNVSLEVSQSSLALAQSKEKIGVAAGGVEQAEENFRLTKHKFAGGTATNADLLDSEIALLQAKLNYTLSVVDNELAAARLSRALGTSN